MCFLEFAQSRDCVAHLRILQLHSVLENAQASLRSLEYVQGRCCNLEKNMQGGLCHLEMGIGGIDGTVI